MHLATSWSATGAGRKSSCPLLVGREAGTLLDEMPREGRGLPGRIDLGGLDNVMHSGQTGASCNVLRPASAHGPDGR
ncbi:hypothetical protein BRAO375_1310062 [Bradyrhizobium sp. ORS 375]|nr:hypothetical protein BRAO375_1310062 [Bradyrhizobium sp. ORS 375]